VVVFALGVLAYELVRAPAAHQAAAPSDEVINTRVTLSPQEAATSFVTEDSKADPAAPVLHIPFVAQNAYALDLNKIPEEMNISPLRASSVILAATL